MKPVYKIMFFVSLTLVVLALAALAIYGLKLGVDFRGGSVLELTFPQARPSAAELQTMFSASSKITLVSVSPVGERGAILRLNELDEATHQLVLKDFQTRFGAVTENQFSSVGPTVGSELRSKSITAIIVLLLAISIYIAFVFRQMSRVLSPWAMGGAAIVALIHDVSIPVGVFALLGHYRGIEVSAVFVAAILTILGYSVSDTVVVFDRVRENVLRYGSKESFGALVHKSILQTLARSINTNITVLLSLIAIYLFGGASVQYFALALIIGIFLGAYSSIFVASPLLVWWSGRRARR